VAKDSRAELLESLFGRLVNNFNDSSRIHINDSIRIIIDDYVRSDSIFSHKFTNLRYLGEITSPDSLIKIVTWNLVLRSNPGRYFCYFIRKGNEGKGNIIYSLTTDYADTPVRTDTTYSLSDWYGALYYEIRPFLTDYIQSWVLLGIDYGNPLITRKIVEVIGFDDNDSVVFGRKWFVSGGDVKYREVMEYASQAAMSLRFTSEKSIFFDHLVPFSPSRENDRQYYGPDYSTDAYYLVNGMWRLSVNVDSRNKE